MKKSFILSLVMVVVLIASLATATYAWYTSQTAVRATETTVTTANAGDSIVIKGTHITSTNETNDTVSLAMEAATGGRSSIYMPTVLKNTTNAYSGLNFSTIQVINSTVDKAGNFNADGAEFAPAAVVAVTDNAATNANGYIYVANVGATDKAYKVKVTLGEAVNKCMRVALFKADDIDADENASLANTNFTLLGIWSAGGSDVLGAASISSNDVPGTVESALAAGGVYASGSFVNAGHLTGNTTGTISENDVYAIRVWFEGDRLTNSGVNTAITFSIDFQLA